MKKFRNILLLLLLVVAGSVLFFFRSENTEGELASLNTKYGLFEFTCLNELDLSEKISVEFNNDILKAGVIDANKEVKEVLVKVNGGEISAEGLDNIYLLKLRTNEDVVGIADAYANVSIVQFAEPNYEVMLDEVDSSDDSALDVEKSDSSDEVGVKDSVVVAIIDSGVDESHAGLRSRIVNGWDFVNGKMKVTDTLGHGTHLAGIVIQNAPNVKIMPVKFTDGKTGDIATLSRAIKFATDKGVDILNLSLGLKKESKTLKEATNYSQKKGVIVVAAAGNYDSDDEYFPAASKDVFAVAALGKDGEKLYMSNYGDWVDFSAQGQDVYSFAPGDGYSYKSGTSQATSYVVAKIAEILADFEGSGEEDKFLYVKEKLEELSVPMGGKYEGVMGEKI